MSLIVSKPSKIDLESRENYGLIRYQVGKTLRAENYNDKAKEVERLKNIVAINDANLKSVKFPSEQSDANEFVLPLFEALYQEKPLLTVSKLTPRHNSKSYIEKDSRGEEQVSITLELNNKKKKASELLENYNKLEELGESEDVYFEEKTKNQTKKVKTNKQIRSFVKDDVNEIVVSLKRFKKDFSGDATKLDDKIEFDNLELPVVNLKNFYKEEDDHNLKYSDLSDSNKLSKARFEPTAFISHRGSFSGGHYVTFVKEKDNKWYCYNDSVRTFVDDNDLKDEIKKAYIVKYSKVGKDGKVELPDIQTSTHNPSNACWANATAIFAGSFVSFAHLKDYVLNQEYEKKKYKEITGLDSDYKMQNYKKGSSNIDLDTLPDFEYTDYEREVFGLNPKKLRNNNNTSSISLVNSSNGVKNTSNAFVNNVSGNLVNNKSTVSGSGLTTSVAGANSSNSSNGGKNTSNAFVNNVFGNRNKNQFSGNLVNNKSTVSGSGLTTSVAGSNSSNANNGANAVLNKINPEGLTKKRTNEIPGSAVSSFQNEKQKVIQRLIDLGFDEKGNKTR